MAWCESREESDDPPGTTGNILRGALTSEQRTHCAVDVPEAKLRWQHRVHAACQGCAAQQRMQPGRARIRLHSGSGRATTPRARDHITDLKQL